MNNFDNVANGDISENLDANHNNEVFTSTEISKFEVDSIKSEDMKEYFRMDESSEGEENKSTSSGIGVSETTISTEKLSRQAPNEVAENLVDAHRNNEVFTSTEISKFEVDSIKSEDMKEYFHMDESSEGEENKGTSSEISKINTTNTTDKLERSEVRDDNTNREVTGNTPEEREYLKEGYDNGEIEIIESCDDVYDSERSNPRIPRNAELINITEGSYKFKPNNADAIGEMKKHGVEYIFYNNFQCDFKPVATHTSEWGEINTVVEIPHMTEHRRNGGWEYGRRSKEEGHDINCDLGNFAQAENALASKINQENPEFNVTGEDIENYRINNNLIWHEESDGKTMMLVPKSIHESCPHTGGVAEMRYRGKWGAVYD